MTLEIILGILVIAGTVTGTGLGYALSMRGKREEWAKEYRAKRLSAIINFVNEYMGAVWQYKFETSLIETMGKELEQGADDKELVLKTESLIEAHEKQIYACERNLELIGSELWRGYFAATELDEQLHDIMEKWTNSLIHYQEQPTDDNLEELMSLAKQLLARADKVIIKGGKTPISKRWTKLIIKVWKKPNGEK